MMHSREKSDSAIVAGKPTNKAVSTAAEPVERRAEAKGNASQRSTRRTQSRVKCVTGAGAHTASRNENALPSHTQGGSRMPELGPYGSVRGALSNERPYRDPANPPASYLIGTHPVKATGEVFFGWAADRAQAASAATFCQCQFQGRSS